MNVKVEVIRGSPTRKHITAINKVARTVLKQVYMGYANVSICFSNRYGVKTLCILAYEYKRSKGIVRARAYVDDGLSKAEYIVTIKP